METCDDNSQHIWYSGPLATDDIYVTFEDDINSRQWQVQDNRQLSRTTWQLNQQMPHNYGLSMRQYHQEKPVLYTTHHAQTENAAGVNVYQQVQRVQFSRWSRFQSVPNGVNNFSHHENDMVIPNNDFMSIDYHTNNNNMDTLDSCVLDDKVVDVSTEDTNGWKPQQQSLFTEQHTVSFNKWQHRHHEEFQKQMQEQLYWQQQRHNQQEFLQQSFKTYQNQEHPYIINQNASSTASNLASSIQEFQLPSASRLPLHPSRERVRVPVA